MPRSRSASDKLDGSLIIIVDYVPVTFHDVFGRVLTNFQKTPTNVFVLLETLILTCVLVEAIIKKLLMRVSPALILREIDPEVIAMISGKKSKLLASPTKELSEVATATITEQLRRLSKFLDISHYYVGLSELFKTRNRVVHSIASPSLHETDISILLTRYAFPFIYEHVSTSDETWRDILKIKKVAQDRFKIHLVRKIVEHRRTSCSLAPEVVNQRIESGTVPLLENEFVETSNLLCPSCQHSSMSYIVGADFDVADGETVAHGYTYAVCRVCELRLEGAEMIELIMDFQSYFYPKPAELDQWRGLLFPPCGDW